MFNKEKYFFGEQIKYCLGKNTEVHFPPFAFILTVHLF